MLVYPMYYISTPGLKHHTQRLRWQGACLPQICLLRSIGTLVRLKHQLSLTSKACPARGSFKQPECNIPLTLGKNKRPFGLWYLFLCYLHCSGSKAVAHQALKQSETQTTTQLFHTNMWESPKSTSKHGEDLLKSMVLDGSYFSFLARVNLSSRASESPCPPMQDSQEDLWSQLQEAAFSSWILETVFQRKLLKATELASSPH